MVLSVTYDLEMSDDHEALIDPIDRLGAAVEIQRSVPVVATELTVDDAFDDGPRGPRGETRAVRVARVVLRGAGLPAPRNACTPVAESRAGIAPCMNARLPMHSRFGPLPHQGRAGQARRFIARDRNVAEALVQVSEAWRTIAIVRVGFDAVGV